MLTNSISNLLQENIFYIMPLSEWALVLCFVFIVSLTATYIYKYTHSDIEVTSHWWSWADFTSHILKFPVLFLIFGYALYFAWNIYQMYLLPEQSFSSKMTAPYLLRIIEVVVFCWIGLNFLILGKKRLLSWAANRKSRTLNILLPAISSSLQAAVFLMMVNMIIPELGLAGQQALVLQKLAKVLLIGVLGWIFYQAVNVLEKFIINQYIEHNTNISTARKINTQVLILKRVILTIGFIVTLGASLTVFDSVKNLGTGLLTTAGIISAVGAFASQQSLGRLFAGLQIAFTQPIRIGDTVMIDHEVGQVEEITLSYIVIKLWDLRKLIMPTDYFTSKGVQNLTRDSTQLLGTIFIYADYTLPIDELRAKYQEFLEASKLWDKKVSAFQVTDIKESTLEIRALMSAENSSTLWNLRCEIRELLIKYIVQHYPQCLAKSRTLALSPSNEAMAVKA